MTYKIFSPLSCAIAASYSFFFFFFRGNEHMKKEKVTTSINLTKYINTACDDIKVYTFSIKWPFAYRVHVFIFTFSAFFFFLPAFVDFGGQILLLWTVYALFTHCAYTVHVLKNIKNESHYTIYTFKNYFATVFSVFSNNKLNPNGPKACIIRTLLRGRSSKSSYVSLIWI